MENEEQKLMKVPTDTKNIHSTSHIIHCTSCVRCEVVIGATIHFVKLNPCNHKLCTECAMMHLAGKAHGEHCPCCDIMIDGHIYHRPLDINPSTVSSKESDSTASSPIFYSKQDKKRDPYRTWAKTKPRDGEGFFYAVVARKKSTSSGDDKITMNALTTEFDMKKGFKSPEDQKKFFQIAAKWFYTLLFKNYATDEEKTDTIDDFINYALLDNSDAMNFLVPCATGIILDEEQRNLLFHGPSEWRSIFMAIFVAKEMLIRAGRRTPSRLQTLLSDVIFTMTGSAQLINILSSFRLTSSISTIRRRNAREVKELASKKKPSEPFK